MYHLKSGTLFQPILFLVAHRTHSETPGNLAACTVLPPVWTMAAVILPYSKHGGYLFFDGGADKRVD